MRLALGTIQATALFDAPERVVHVRVGALDGKLYLDLADEQWHAVEIDTTGWRIIADPPIRFRRAPGMQPLPEPVRGGAIRALRRFLNVGTGNDFTLAVAWLLAALRNRGPYPVLVLSGEEGTAKSTAANMLRAIVDPNTADLRALPREERDLYIAANNGHVVAFDNLSWLSSSISDSLCRLAAGGGFATRQLYTDSDEMLFEAVKPIILAGIEDVVVRGDLAGRSIFLRLDPIPEHRRQPEADLRLEFEAARPAILGALLNAVAHGLRELPHTRLARLPRMADFAVWASACEGALWPPCTFMPAYAANRADATETVIEADAVATAVRSLMTKCPAWSGTATELLTMLLLDQSVTVTRARAWPASARVLSARLRRAAVNLRRVGIAVAFDREGHNRERVITIRVAASDDAGPRPSSASASAEIARPGNGLGVDPPRTQTRPADATELAADDATPAIVRSNLPKKGVADGADAADAKIPPSAGAVP